MKTIFCNNEYLDTISENSDSVTLHGSNKFFNRLVEFNRKQLHREKFDPESDLKGFKKSMDGFSFEVDKNNNSLENVLFNYNGKEGLLQKCFDNFLGYKDGIKEVSVYNQSVDDFYSQEECSKITITRIDDPKNGFHYRVDEASYGYGGAIDMDWSYKDGVRNGYCRNFDSLGHLKSNICYQNDKRHGKSVDFFPITDHILERQEYTYSEGKKIGNGIFAQYSEFINLETRKFERKFNHNQTEKVNFSRKSKPKNPYLGKDNSKHGYKL